MKISAFIAELEKIRQEHGDLRVMSDEYFVNHGCREAGAIVMHLEADPRYSHLGFHGLSKPGERIVHVR